MFNIEHQTDESRFIITLQDEPAVLEYRLMDAHTLDFSRTYVPFRHRGKGIAEALVAEGLAWANGQGFTIQASCWYVDKFLPKP